MFKKKEGFTLVELLVVIAIIIILAAILFPVFARARDKAQQTKCVNNLKQMGTAIAMYEDDYDDVLPFGVWSPAGRLWMDLMDPYIKQLNGTAGYEETQGELYKCPSAPIEEATIAYQAGRSYGYNPFLNFDASMNTVKFPSSTLRITEGSAKDPDGPANAPDPGGSMVMPYPGRQGFPGYAPGWHSGFNSCLWFDGHVCTMTRQRVMMSDNNANPGVWARLSPKPGFTPEGG